MDTLLDALTRWKPFTALVLGDFMLDQQLFGDAERLSADAPVPVLRVTRQEAMPGGAGNLAEDLVALGGHVKVFGVTGEDAEGTMLRERLEAAGIETGGLVTDATRPTTVKRNLIGLAQHRHPQKMFRVDFESREALPDRVSQELLAGLEAALAGADVLCLEDYDKGVCDQATCQAAIELARKHGVPLLVDPASRDDFARYRGCTSITPNRSEAERATGRRHAMNSAAQREELARELSAQLDCETVVLTLDKDGALLLERDAQPLTIPTVAREVYDVTGAGDMMLAGLAAARANGLSWSDAVRFANAAAGLEVQIFGVKPIPLADVHRELLRQAGRLTGKLRTLDEMRGEVESVRRNGGTVVFTNGCFDVLHAGHVTLLERAASFGDFLVVGLNSDASVRRLKGEGRPVHNGLDRARVLGALEPVGAVVFFEDDTPLELIEALTPDVLVKGADYAGKEVVGQGVVEAAGGRVELVGLVEGLSTTSALSRMGAQG
ncbi:MAG: D-glycero-beta-D-manno-heptose 1-phosphate adenylyltransferase [Phycisphaerales bacterium JB060]